MSLISGQIINRTLYKSGVTLMPSLPFEQHLVGWNITWLWFVRFANRFAWWRYEMDTFSALLAICAGNSPVPGEFPAQRPVTRSFDVLFDLRLNKRLSEQSWGWWFETLSRPLWRHRNGIRFHCPILWRFWYVEEYRCFIKFWGICLRLRTSYSIYVFNVIR